MKINKVFLRVTNTVHEMRVMPHTSFPDADLTVATEASLLSRAARGRESPPASMRCRSSMAYVASALHSRSFMFDQEDRMEVRETAAIVKSTWCSGSTVPAGVRL